MTVQDLFRIMLDDEYVEIEFKNEFIWYGKVKDMPNCYFNCIVKLIFSIPYRDDSYMRIVINNIE